jgi:hypothetical protein
MKDLAITAMTRRVHISLSDGMYEDLNAWADQEKTSPTALAGSLVENAVRSAKLSGVLRTRNPTVDYKSFSQLVSHNLALLIETGKFESAQLKKLMEGKQPTEVERLRIALIVGVSEDYISSLPLSDRP